MGKLKLRKVAGSASFRPLIWLGIVMVSLLIVVLVSSRASAPTAPMPVEGSTVTLTGEFTCLPHKDTEGPQTLECAFGLKTGDTYYALGDSTSDYSLLSGINTGATITVTGQFKAHPDSKYQDIGTVIVTKVD